MKTPMKFLVVQQKMIGDVLASTVICESLKHHYPDAIVHMVANENTLPVLENNPFIDKIIVFRNEYRASKTTFYHFLKSLQKTPYNAVIDAYGKLESNLISLFSRADSKISNNKWYSSWVYTDTVNQKRVADGKVPLSISNRLMLLRPLVGESGFVSRPKLYLSKRERDFGHDLVDKLRDYKAQKIIMISILGSSGGKTYPAIYMSKILDVTCQHCDAKLVFNYLPQQEEKALEIFRLCSKKTQKKIDIAFYANSLRDFIAVVSHCDMIIGNEGGAINMAKAVEVPSFSIFSPFIPKGNWHAEVNKQHEGVHLRDYKPHLFEGKDKKQLRKNSLELYGDFEPELFKKSLLDFLDRNCGDHLYNEQNAR